MINVDKINEIVKSDYDVNTVSIVQEPKIVQKTVWNHLNKVGYKKKFDMWGPHELTQKISWIEFLSANRC